MKPRAKIETGGREPRYVNSDAYSANMAKKAEVYAPENALGQCESVRHGGSISTPMYNFIEKSSKTKKMRIPSTFMKRWICAAGHFAYRSV